MILKILNKLRLKLLVFFILVILSKANKFETLLVAFKIFEISSIDM